MSLSYQPIKSRILLDPIVDTIQDYTYLIQRSGKNNTFQQIISQNVSSSSLTFTTVPPSLVTYVNRKQFIGVPIRFYMYGQATVPGSGILQIGIHDALKAYPLQNYLFTTSSATINNTNVAINSSDIIEPLLRTNMYLQNQKYDFSLTPTYPDVYQNYDDFENGNYGSKDVGVGANDNSIVSSNNNPLGAFGLNYEGGGRGGFPYVIIKNTDTEAIVDVFITEQLFLPPLVTGHENHPGLIGVNQINYQFNLNNNALALGNMWAHSEAGNPITSISAQIVGSGTLDPAFGFRDRTSPTLFLNFVTPYSVASLPPLITYPYYEIIRFPTDSQLVKPGFSALISSNNIQLNSIPNRIYIVAKRKNEEKTFLTTDTYALINRLSINYKNRSSLLGSATPIDLYNMSIHNGVKLTWPEYSKYTGSIVCINPAFDLGEEDESCSNGVLENIQLQINADITNLNLSKSITFSLYIICVNEGTFTVDLTNNSARQQIGVLSRQEVLNASLLEKINYNAALNLWGGDFYSSIKSGVKHVANAVKTAAPYISKGAHAVGQAARVVKSAADKASTLSDLALVGLGSEQPRRRSLKHRY